MITGEQFLHELNPGFQASPEIEAVTDYLRQNGERIPNEPAEKISAYVGFLATVANDGVLTHDSSSIRRQVAHHAITRDHIPDSYFELRRRIAREQGRGDLDITPEDRRHAGISITKEQRHSLGKWASYLSDETYNYPDWFKLYAFKAVTRMGKYNAGSGEYQKRSATTVAPYPELDEAVVANVYTWLKRSKLEGQTVAAFRYPEKEHAFQRALTHGNFAKLYALGMQKTHGMYYETIANPHNGTWIKYPQHSDSEKLRSDLQGFNLDWCTAREKETAAKHISDGDFYVYFMADKAGNHTVPHVAIRMEDDTVAEVRGIRDYQEMEMELSEVVSLKLKTLNGGETFFQKIADMKRLSDMEVQIKASPQARLSRSDLIFLYQIDRKIDGFGYEEDPRIAEFTQLQQDIDGETALQKVARLMGMSGASEDHDALMQALLSDHDHLVPLYMTDMRQLSARTLDGLYWSESFLSHLETTTNTSRDEAYVEYVLEHIDKFDEISVSFARDIAALSLSTLLSIAHKCEESIRHGIDFESVRVHQIYEIGSSAFAKHLPNFKNVDIKAAKWLLDHGEDDAVLDNLAAFSSLTLAFIDKYFLDKRN